MVRGEWAATGSEVPKACPKSGFLCPGYDADTVNDPPGSQPIEVNAGSARATRTVALVTFGLRLETDLSSYDATATKEGLASLFGVATKSISLAVEAGSLRLAVTIKPANVSGAFVAKLVEAINSTSPGELTSALGSDATVQQVEANILEQEYEATW